MKYLKLTVALLLCASLTYAAPGKGKKHNKKKTTSGPVQLPSSKPEGRPGGKVG